MTGSMRNNATGLAGELRVMSELLLRGHNPAKSYLESGPDIVLENNLRIEVKSCHRGLQNHNYNIVLKGGGRKKQQDLSDCDYLICWCIDDNLFLIIPKDKIKTSCIGIGKLTKKSKYFEYIGQWDALKLEVK